MDCINQKVGVQICNSIGTKVDVDEKRSAWGKFLCVKIGINLRKPIPRGRTINVEGNKFWVLLKYEKLPSICFKRGLMAHRAKGCQF